MGNNRFIVIVGAGTIPHMDRLFHEPIYDHIVHTPTADIYVGPPPIDIRLKPESMIPEIDLRPLREPKKRDWEQRQRKPRRRS